MTRMRSVAPAPPAVSVAAARQGPSLPPNKENFL